MRPESIRLGGDSSTLRGRALIALREKLLKGSFALGKRLEEIELSQSLGLSRPILRSVLEQLSFEGLVEPMASGGYAPRRFTIEDIRDAILARSALEGVAAGLAAKRIQDPAELEAARSLNSELAETLPSSGLPTPEQMSRFGDLNAAFHAAFVAIARSPMLSWCLDRVRSAAFASPAAVVLPAGGDGAHPAFGEHQEILNAIEARDPVRADALVREHAHLAIEALASAIEGHPHLSRTIAL
jgi:GntR family transcriptional regulator of vanillate catabolism